MRIRRKLNAKRGRRREVAKSPAEEKNEWALRSLRLDDGGAIATREAAPPPQRIEKTIHHWWRSSWDTIWDEYQSGLGAGDRPPAQLGGLWTGRRTLHEGLQKAESSVLTQMRTGKIGLAAFLYQYRVPGYISASCGYGWRRQDTKHILIHCPRLQGRRQELKDTSGAVDAYRMLAKAGGAKRAARWMIQTGLLGQFSLAAKQLYQSRPWT